MNIGLIGCGKMGSALLEGICSSDEGGRKQVRLCDAHVPSAEGLAETLEEKGVSVSVLPSISEVVQGSDIILLSVKPGDVPSALTEGGDWTGKLLLSVAAGISTETLAEHIGSQARIIRVMPNTPALIGEGASAFCRGPGAKVEDALLASELLSTVGTVSEVSEKLMDAVTGLSGSGPAYGYLIIEALSDAGVKRGLPRDTALELACQTVKGAALMIQETELHPSVLRDQVTSPGGTTIAGLSVLEEKGLRNALISAVDAATERSIELGKG